MKLTEVLEAIQRGEDVRRPHWPEGYFKSAGGRWGVFLAKADILAEDYFILEEEDKEIKDRLEAGI